MPRTISLPEKLLECKDPLCQKLNQIYQQAKILDKQLLVQMVKELRKNPRMSAEDMAERFRMARATLFYKLKKMGVKYQELVNAVLEEAEEKYKRKLERRVTKRLPPKDKQEFLERDIVKKVLQRMKTAGVKESFITRVINYWYKMCKTIGLAPEDFVDMKREQLWDLITQYLSDRADEDIDIRNDISVIQAIQKWLGVRILPPGVTQREYKGKFQEAEIDLEHREKIVRDLLEQYRQTRDVIYLKTIQAMAFLFYTGSRRQALLNFTWGDLVRIKLKDFTERFGEEKFRAVSTLEKRGIRWTKLIPYSYYEILPNTTFSPSEVKKIARVLKQAMMKYYNEYNHHTQLYLQKSKVFHIWRHTACRTYLRAFKYNRSLVAKLLGWIKESNLIIYGDFQLFQLLNIMAEEHDIKFVRPELYQEIRREILRVGLA